MLFSSVYLEVCLKCTRSRHTICRIQVFLLVRECVLALRSLALAFAASTNCDFMQNKAVLSRYFYPLKTMPVYLHSGYRYVMHHNHQYLTINVDITYLTHIRFLRGWQLF